jgi:hypothetical protein
MVVINGDEIMLGQPSLGVEKSSSENFSILIKTTSRGRDRESAQQATKEVFYNYELTDSTLTFDPYFVIEKGGRWRDQEVEITLKVPEGKSIFMDEDLVRIIHDIENVSNTWDGDMVDKFWEMKPDGLTMKEISE